MTYKCDSHYIHWSGNLTRRCRADKSWSGVSPVCKGKHSDSDFPCVLRPYLLIHPKQIYNKSLDRKSTERLGHISILGQVTTNRRCELVLLSENA